MVAKAGADFIGVIVGIEISPRQLSLKQACVICEQSLLPVVALFLNQDEGYIQETVAVLQPHAVQLQGQESPELVRRLSQGLQCEVWKAIHLPPAGGGKSDFSENLHYAESMIEAGARVLLIDTITGSAGKNRRFGGTGQVNDWALAKKLVDVITVPVFLAGGIKPENVRNAIDTVNPFGIDLASGVEHEPGQKSPEKVEQLMAAIRATES